ncbi:MAG: site-2 protease family protein [Anaerolineales bacterium]|nr:site-2 protease family protein [Anaerolineales bacterium]MCW5855727.1 site-2 protease family protein [Anaerolineales bacterium]
MSEPTEAFEPQEMLTPHIARVFDIQQIIPGGGRFPFITKYVGRLTQDSETAYAALSHSLDKMGITPLFLEEKGQHIIQLMPSPPKPKGSNPLVNLVMFILTVVSMLMAGTLYSYDGPAVEDSMLLIQQVFARLGDGVPFAASLLAILLAHEFGHYLAARYHKTAVTLPYFLPFPLSIFGTLGAFIQLKEPPRNKRVLLDIGLAGPLAGLLVAIPVLLLGLSLSEITQLPNFVRAGDAYSLEGNSILYLLAKYAVHGQWLPQPASYELSPLLHWVRFLFTGQPIPLGGADVFLHPIAWAGWAGLLVTALNLIPAGQLDGGHLLYSLLGKLSSFALPVILGVLAVLGFFWSGWWLWVFLILMMGGRHAQPLDQITQLDRPRILLAIFGLIIFLLVFIPVPLQIIEGPFGG